MKMTIVPPIVPTTIAMIVPSGRMGIRTFGEVVGGDTGDGVIDDAPPVVMEVAGDTVDECVPVAGFVVAAVPVAVAVVVSPVGTVVCCIISHCDMVPSVATHVIFSTDVKVAELQSTLELLPFTRVCPFCSRRNSASLYAQLVTLQAMFVSPLMDLVPLHCGLLLITTTSAVAVAPLLISSQVYVPHKVSSTLVAVRSETPSFWNFEVLATLTPLKIVVPSGFIHWTKPLSVVQLRRMELPACTTWSVGVRVNVATAPVRRKHPTKR